MSADKPYRPNVGVALFDAHGRVLIAHRIQNDGPEVINPGMEWQMPQGGIDADEDPRAAAFRELYEETGVRSAAYLGETDWMTYDFPDYYGPPHKLAAFRGQRQKWFALRFIGHEREIDVSILHGGEEIEFDDWKFVTLAEAAGLVVPFKRAVYVQVAREFARFAMPNR